MSRFFLIVLLFFLATQALAFSIIVHRLRRRPWAVLFTIILFFAANLPWFYLPLASSSPNPPAAWIVALVVRPFLTWQVGVWLWLIVGAALSLTLLIVFRLPSNLYRWWKKSRGWPQRRRQINQERRAFLIKTTNAALYTGVAAGTGWGLVRQSFAPKVVHYDVPFTGLPQSLAGLTIAHLSDLHIGLWTTPDDVGRTLEVTRDLKPDLVVITGDIIEHNPSYASVLTKRLGMISGAPLGVFGIIGNHDVYTGAEAVAAGLEQGGINMLRNTHSSMQPEGLPLLLVGIDDPGRHWAGSGGPLPLEAALAGRPEGLFPILLTHRPTGFEQAVKAGIPLTLCGHTHGGQFGLPNGPNLADLSYKHTHGLYREPGGFIHVTAGIGAIGLPFRLGVPPEVAILRLVQA